MRFDLWLAITFGKPAWEIKAEMCPDCLQRMHTTFLTISN